MPPGPQRASHSDPSIAANNVGGEGAGAATTLDMHIVKIDLETTTYHHNLNLHALISSGRLTQAQELFDGMLPDLSAAFSLNRMLCSYSSSVQIAAHELLLSSLPRLVDTVTWTITVGALVAAPAARSLS
jgi:hypothetical protein